MKLNTNAKKVIEEVPYGTYVWVMNDGTYLVDEEYRHLSIFCMKGDLRAIAALSNEARNLGFGDGHVEWLSGTRKVSDDEYEEQMARQNAGMVADPYDYGALREDINNQIARSRND